ncbi:MAG TPA: hypothetical protein DCE56_06000 [Cyanobacteria bacterium UBA8553]|nr:hypothetical protein [Cyanobacteria bacterium UBA8553]HAJ62897.1 hypothetical protein [Cyanobacteria bacterium UBA8543]
MLRYCYFTTALSTVLISLLPEVGLTNPLLIGNQYPVVQISEQDTPVCYLKTEDGRILDLGKLCKKTPQDSNISSSPQDSNTSSSSSFEPEKCYFLDAAGRPCIATQN